MSEESEDRRSAIRDAIAILLQAVKPPLEAVSYRLEWPSWSRPMLLRCRNGVDVVVKHHAVGTDRARACVTEQVVARTAFEIGFPVGEPLLIEITDELRRADGRVAKYPSGIIHGHRYVPNMVDCDIGDFAALRENRPRYAALAILFGVAVAGDEQVLVSEFPPHLVSSNDHGWFLPNGPDWSSETLSLGKTNGIEPFPPIIRECTLTKPEIRAAIASLSNLTDDMITRAVSFPSTSWGVSLDERADIAEFLLDRRNAFLAHKVE